MKTLEQRDQELRVERLAKEQALQQQAVRESRIAEALSREIKEWTKKRIALRSLQVEGSQIVIIDDRGVTAYIKVVSDGKGPNSFTFSSETIKLEQGSEDDVLEAILNWFRE